MTLHRWRKDGFPQPYVINKRNYWTSAQIEQDIPAWFQRKFAE